MPVRRPIRNASIGIIRRQRRRTHLVDQSTGEGEAQVVTGRQRAAIAIREDDKVAVSSDGSAEGEMKRGRIGSIVKAGAGGVEVEWLALWVIQLHPGIGGECE